MKLHSPDPVRRRPVLPGSRSGTDHGIRPHTLAWIGGLHLAVILLLGLSPQLFRPEPQDNFIEMVSLGEPDPGRGDTLEDASTEAGPVTPRPPSHAPAPPSPVAPPPVTTQVPTPKPPQPPPTLPKPQPPPATPPENTLPKPTPTPTPVAPPAPKPAESKPKPTPVKVNLTPVKRNTGSTAGTPSAAPKHTQNGAVGSGQGLSSAEIKARLAGKVGTTGTADGTGAGKPGDPNGNPNADPYNALIKITLEKAWNKPSIAEVLQTHVRIRVKPDGRIEFEGLERSSGNAEMDATVIAAVHQVPKMPQPPPAGLGNPDYVVTINFKLH